MGGEFTVATGNEATRTVATNDSKASDAGNGLATPAANGSPSGDSTPVFVEGNLTIREGAHWTLPVRSTGDVTIETGCTLDESIIADANLIIGDASQVSGSVTARKKLEWGAGATAVGPVEGRPFVVRGKEVARRLVARGGVWLAPEDERLNPTDGATRTAAVRAERVKEVRQG